VPYTLAIAVAFLLALYWLFFFTLGETATIDTHLTNTPQTDAAFRLTPWRPAPPGVDTPAERVTREAIRPLGFRTLRFEQASDDWGVSVYTERYHADIRWGTTAVALTGSLVAPVAVYLTLKRLLR
jgi:hypothetical protein